MRFDMLAMSDAMRGFLINPANQAEQRAQEAGGRRLRGDVEEIRKLAPQGEILKLLQEAADMDSKILNRIEDDLLAVIAARRDRKRPRPATPPSTSRSARSRRRSSRDIEKETIRLKQVGPAVGGELLRVARATTWMLVLGVTSLGLAVSFLLGAKPGPPDRAHGGVHGPRREGRPLGRPRVRRRAPTSWAS